MTIKYEHLLGRDFNIETANCYHMLCDIYRDTWAIELTDYPCPVDFCERRMDIYSKMADQEGFYLLNCHPRDYHPGDVFLIAIDCPYGNHVAVMLEDGRIVHHLVGQLSRVTSYGGVFRNCTVGVYRHRLVPLERVEEKVNFRDLLPAHMQKKFDAMAAARALEMSEPGPTIEPVEP